MIEEDAEEAPRPAAKRGKSAPAAPRGRKPQAPEEGAGAEPAPKKKRAPPKKKDPNPEEGKDGPGEVAEGAGAELAPKKKRAPAKKKTAAVAEGGAEGAGAGALGAEGAGEEGGEAKPSKGRGRGAGAGKRSKSAPGTPGEAEAAEAAAEGEGTKKKKAPRKKKKKEAEGEEGEEDEEGGEGEDDGPYQVYDDQDASESDWEEPIIPELEPPACVTAPLLPYQKEFLHWAVKQEKGPIRGGLLAECVHGPPPSWLPVPGILMQLRESDHSAHSLTFSPLPVSQSPPLKSQRDGPGQDHPGHLPDLRPPHGRPAPRARGQAHGGRRHGRRGAPTPGRLLRRPGSCSCSCGRAEQCRSTKRGGGQTECQAGVQGQGQGGQAPAELGADSVPARGGRRDGRPRVPRDAGGVPRGGRDPVARGGGQVDGARVGQGGGVPGRQAGQDDAGGGRGAEERGHRGACVAELQCSAPYCVRHCVRDAG